MNRAMALANGFSMTDTIKNKLLSLTYSINQGKAIR